MVLEAADESAIRLWATRPVDALETFAEDAPALAAPMLFRATGSTAKATRTGMRSLRDAARIVRRSRSLPADSPMSPPI
jgi:hypothetical protein